MNKIFLSVIAIFSLGSQKIFSGPEADAIRKVKLTPSNTLASQITEATNSRHIIFGRTPETRYKHYVKPAVKKLIGHLKQEWFYKRELYEKIKTIFKDNITHEITTATQTPRRQPDITQVEKMINGALEKLARHIEHQDHLGRLALAYWRADTTSFTQGTPQFGATAGVNPNFATDAISAAKAVLLFSAAGDAGGVLQEFTLRSENIAPTIDVLSPTNLQQTLASGQMFAGTFAWQQELHANILNSNNQRVQFHFSDDTSNALLNAIAILSNRSLNTDHFLISLALLKYNWATGSACTTPLFYNNGQGSADIGTTMEGILKVAYPRIPNVTNLALILKDNIQQKSNLLAGISTLEISELAQTLLATADAGSQSNGSLMALAPIATTFYNNPNNACHVAELATKIIHSHPNVIACSRIFTQLLCDVINFAGKGQSLDAYKQFIAKSFNNVCKEEAQKSSDPTTINAMQEYANNFIFNQTPSSLKFLETRIASPAEIATYPWLQHSNLNAANQPYFLSSSGGCVAGTLVALAAVWAHNTPEQMISWAVQLGSDTDTNAAITGMLAGAIYGQDKFLAHWKQAIYAFPLLEQTAQALTAPNGIYPHVGELIKNLYNLSNSQALVPLAPLAATPPHAPAYHAPAMQTPDFVNLCANCGLKPRFLGSTTCSKTCRDKLKAQQAMPPAPVAPARYFSPAPAAPARRGMTPPRHVPAAAPRAATPPRAQAYHAPAMQTPDFVNLCANCGLKPRFLGSTTCSKTCRDELKAQQAMPPAPVAPVRYFSPAPAAPARRGMTPPRHVPAAAPRAATPPRAPAYQAPAMQTPDFVNLCANCGLKSRYPGSTTCSRTCRDELKAQQAMPPAPVAPVRYFSPAPAAPARRGITSPRHVPAAAPRAATPPRAPLDDSNH